MRPPVVWSVAGLDSGGGAGLSADQRAADAAGVHLCPVAAALTAQNSIAVEAVMAVPPAQLEAQLAALADDLAPAAIKTGLLGCAANVVVLARWVDRLRERAPLALVVDPVLRASTGAPLADEALVAAYREWLLPRASALTPNRREAAALLGVAEARSAAEVPAQARGLQALGVEAVCITGSDADETAAHDWLASPQACGWLSLPRRASRHSHGTGCCFATAWAGAMARGFVAADGAVLAKMLTTSALDHDGATPGAGSGPVRPRADFIARRELLPAFGVGEQEPQAPQAAISARAAGPGLEGVYGITDSAADAARLMAAGLRVVQLRSKRGAQESAAAWQERIRAQIAQALAAAREQGATLVVNDHWREAVALGADYVHLGQEDLLALAPEDRRQFAQARERGLRLGISSHSVWELARTVAWQPDYVACGPVWPTLTKAMPWRPQGLDNLAWWVAMAPAPVVAIGGVLEPEQLERLAAAGATAGCVVRGLQ
ncbi:MAG: bifunctional hydroxymethylpyrimidine kinase/phosphomethylpyrimidine kinase, partial [Burkholderiales bacterium]|nr:bifunctional hydroxymethylpyrimidine kinase/phosphomethylpyrimidine kinase [Burkholderiales bacterium]